MENSNEVFTYHDIKGEEVKITRGEMAQQRAVSCKVVRKIVNNSLTAMGEKTFQQTYTTEQIAKALKALNQ